jgi:hypothetical protein
MSIYKTVLEDLKKNTHNKCKLGRWVDSLPAEDQEDVQAILNLDLTENRLTTVLNNFLPISRDVVRSHKRGKCLCHR